MTKLNRLISEARYACERRKHNMLRFAHSGSTYALSDCVKCGRGVAVNTKPMPNQIDIGGPAVAVGCKDREGVLL